MTKAVLVITRPMRRPSFDFLKGSLLLVRPRPSVILIPPGFCSQRLSFHRSCQRSQENTRQSGDGSSQQNNKYYHRRKGCLHLFSTVNKSLLLRGYSFFLLHSLFDPLHLRLPDRSRDAQTSSYPDILSIGLMTDILIIRQACAL